MPAWGNGDGAPGVGFQYNEPMDSGAQTLTVGGQTTLTSGLTVTGQATMNGDLAVTSLSRTGGGTPIQVDDQIAFNDAALLNAGGQSAGMFTVTDELVAKGPFTLGPGNGAAKMDAAPDAGPTARDLEIGGQAGTASVKLSRTDQTTTVNGALTVTQALNAQSSVVNLGQNGGTVTVDGTLQANREAHFNEHLFAESSMSADGDAHFYSNVDVDGNLTVGAGGAAGLIDSGGSVGSPQDVKLGTQTLTSDVEISRSGMKTKVVSDLRVGASGSAGKVDSGGGGVSPQDLRLGAESNTANVVISRSGKVADVFGMARLNGNAIVMNDKASITASGARGMADNPTGQGLGGPSLDFYINGQCVFYVNGTGGHNV